jgi:hypothetical protein
MSHELKTPLTAILGFAELLHADLQASGDELGADSAATIEASGHRLLKIVESILDFVRYDSRAVRLLPSRVSLSRLTSQVASTFAHQAAEKGLPLEVTLPEEEVYAWVDADRTRRVLEELLGNAVRFTKEGRITVCVEQSEQEARIDIHDTGIGIRPADRTKIFDSFTQADEKIHLEYGGLGIGLAIAKTIVDLSMGRLWLESSTPGVGSCFSVSFPRSASAG